jgi:hypothetical protein
MNNSLPPILKVLHSTLVRRPFGVEIKKTSFLSSNLKSSLNESE